MILHVLMKKIEDKDFIADDTPMKIYTDQKDAFNDKKAIDPENAKELMIYPVEV